MSDLQRNVSGITACDVTLTNNTTLPDGYISVSGLPNLADRTCDEVSSYVTQSETTRTIIVTSTQTVTTTQTETSEWTIEPTSAHPPCPCSSSVPTRNMTGSDTQALLNSIVQQLTVDARSTRRSQLKLLSADDRRFSAQAVGYVAVAVIFIVVCVILAIDAPNVYHCVLAKMTYVHTLK